MAKFYGEIGYVDTVENSTGVWKEQVTERVYSGDILRITSKMQSGENLNDNLTIDNKISIIADPFAYTKFYSMRYIRWMGALWKITSVEVQRPRLILSIGGVYNVQSPPTT